MAQRNRAQRLNGLFPLSYMGVVPVSPVNFVIDDRAPTINDSRNFYIGDMWLNNGVNTPPTNEDIYMLVSLVGDVATWVNFGGGDLETLTGDTGGPVSPDGADNINLLGTPGVITVTGNPATHTLTWDAGGTLATLYSTDFDGPAIPASNILEVIGGVSFDSEQDPLVFRKNIHTQGVSNTVFIKLNDSLSFPATSTDGRAGVIYQGGVAANNRFIHSFGTNNTFVGQGSGTLTNTSEGTTGIGAFCLENLTSGVENTTAGAGSLGFLTSGTRNCALGFNAGSLITTANDNVFVGWESGADLAAGAANQNTFVGSIAGANLAGIATNNILLGYSAGSNYTTTESSNIVIGNTGTLTDNHTIRIGTQGAGSAQQNKAFMAGINGVTVASPVFVTIDTLTNQLGVSGTSPVPSYSTGSFTPVLTFGGASVGITYAIQQGTYTQIGNVIVINITIQLTSKGVSVGGALITGLPFTANAGLADQDIFMTAIGAVTFPAGTTYLHGAIVSGATTMSPNADGTGISTIQLTDAEFANTSYFKFSGTYFT